MKVNVRNEFKPAFISPPVSRELAGNATANTRGPVDLVSLKSRSQPANRVKVASGDSLSKMLLNRGFSMKELTARDEKGKSMLDKVAAQNGLRNPNLIYEGQSLSLPNKSGSTKTTEVEKPKQTQTRSLSDRITDIMLPGLKYLNMKVGGQEVEAKKTDLEKKPKQTQTRSLSDRITDAMLPGLKYQNMKVGTVDSEAAKI